jgi:hypothetical protein
MNIPSRKILLSLIIVAVLPAVALAGGKPTPRPKFKPPYDVIQSVDPAAQTVTVGHVNSTDTSTETLKLDKTTEIEVNGSAATLNDVKPGMKVSVTPGMDEGTASRLVLSPAPPSDTKP